MAQTKHRVELIIWKLRKAEGALIKGQKAVEGCRTLPVMEQTSYRWRSE